MTHPFLDHPGPIAFAHRGGAGEAPENTMVAFERTVALGFGYVELDVRASADGAVMVFHDAILDRVTGHTGRLGDYSAQELREVRVDDRDPIPTLADVLGTWPDLRVNIDPKEDAVVGPLIDLLSTSDVLDRVCIMGFSDRRLNRVRKALGDAVCTALGPTGMTRLRLSSTKGVRAGRSPGDVAQVPATVGGVRVLHSGVVETAHDQGLPVHVWVVDYPGEMRRLLDIGVDGIMTDRPTVLRDVMVERNTWPDGT